MSIPDFQSLMLPVLKAATAGEVKVSQVVETLADDLQLSNEDRNELLPSGKQTTFSNRVHWAKTYMTKASLLVSTKRGHFKVTKLGEETLNKKPEKINNAYLSQFTEFQEFRKASKASKKEPKATDTTEATEAETPDAVMREAHRNIELTLRKELLDRILAAPPSFFETIVVNLVVAMGFGGSVEDAGRSLGKTGDGGVDGVIDQDALGLDRVYIQAKRYQAGNQVGAGAVRDFFGSLDTFKAGKGVFVTTSAFSSAAKQAVELMSKRIVLVDGDRLATLMIRHNVGVRVEETLYVKVIDEGFFPE